MANNPIDGIVQAMVNRRPSSGGKQLALATGGGGGGRRDNELHAQLKGDGWEGPWTPVVEPTILREIIRMMYQGQGAASGRWNWTAGE